VQDLLPNTKWRFEIIPTLNELWSETVWKQIYLQIDFSWLWRSRRYTLWKNTSHHFKPNRKIQRKENGSTFHYLVIPLVPFFVTDLWSRCSCQDAVLTCH
jgi:hypothetical protein